MKFTESKILAFYGVKENRTIETTGTDIKEDTLCKILTRFSFHEIIKLYVNSDYRAHQIIVFLTDIIIWYVCQQRL